MWKWQAIIALSVLLAASSAAAKGKPEPIQCPSDVAAALAERCPCDGQRNHGAYVSCVARYRNALRKAGCIDGEVRRTLVRCAARSTCGKSTQVVCCFSSTGTCSDTMPGNALAEGVCSNDSAKPCDADADCTVTSGRVVSDEAKCTANGGTSAGAGSACTACTTSSTTTSTSSTTSTTVGGS